MDFRLSEEQVQLSDSARRFAAQSFDYDTSRKAVPTGDPCDSARWQQLADLGWLALALPEEWGGVGGSAVDFAVLAEALGGAMLPEPLVPVAAAARLLMAAGQADALLGDVAQGKARPVIAHGEADAGGVLAWVEARAERTAAGWHLIGTKSLVLGGAAATHFIVSARTGGTADAADGISLFLVPADAPGLARTGRRLTDDTMAADLALNLDLPAQALIGQEGTGLAHLREGQAWLQLGLHAEALGAMDKALWTTRDYVRTRKQFGTELATFQAVQHRLAHMAMEVELARSILFRLLSVFDGDTAERERILAAAKVQFAKSGFFVGSQAVQLHGGMGMTDEYVVGMLFKRLLLLKNIHGGMNTALASLAGDQRNLAREQA